MQPQLVDRKDCINCKRVLGMKLQTYWTSALDPGWVNIRWECDTCHGRDWERVAIAETKI